MGRTRPSEYDVWFDWEPSDRTEARPRRTQRSGGRPRRRSGLFRWGVVLGLCALLALGAGRLWDGTSPAAVPGGDRVQTPFQPGAELLDQLHAVSGVPVPCRLAELKGKPRRFDKTVEKQAMEQAVLDFLK